VFELIELIFKLMFLPIKIAGELLDLLEHAARRPRRRRRKRQSEASGSGCGCLALLGIVAIVIAAIVAGERKLWRHSHAGAIAVAVLAALLLLVGAVLVLARMETAQERRRAQQEIERAHRLALHAKLPSRITGQWIRDHGSTLPPSEVPHLLEELRSRGWTEAEIENRVRPYLPR
jgi:hypothetical protein